MLSQRILTAVVLLAVLFPALFLSSPVPFLFLILVFLAVGAWEWGRLNQLGTVPSLVTAFFCLALCGLTWLLGGISRASELLWLLGGLAWVVAGCTALWLGVSGWRRIPVALRWLLGVFFLWFAWLAVAQARLVGLNFLLSILALVWVADIGAYFVGRSLGGRLLRSKLAPSISPGKSWEGVWGGMLSVFVFGWGWMWIDQNLAVDSLSIFSRLFQAGVLWFLLGTSLLAAMSVVGDLLESLVKRNAGVKDSGRLLPGHGGVLDRIDALLPTLPLAHTLNLLIGA